MQYKSTEKYIHVHQVIQHYKDDSPLLLAGKFIENRCWLEVTGVDVKRMSTFVAAVSLHAFHHLFFYNAETMLFLVDSPGHLLYSAL